VTICKNIISTQLSKIFPFFFLSGGGEEKGEMIEGWDGGGGGFFFVFRGGGKGEKKKEGQGIGSDAKKKVFSCHYFTTPPIYYFNTCIR